MTDAQLKPIDLVRSVGLGLAAGALFVFTAMAAEQSLIARFSKLARK